MKQLLLISVFSFIFISYDKLDEPDILGTYINIPEGCMKDNDPMNWKYTCNRYLTLSAGGIADILPGGDIVYRITYKLKGKKIKTQKSDQFDMEMTFIRLEEGSIRNEEYKAIWLKQPSNP